MPTQGFFFIYSQHHMMCPCGRHLSPVSAIFSREEGGCWSQQQIKTVLFTCFFQDCGAGYVYRAFQIYFKELFHWHGAFSALK